jgi:tetratricopeptide (TPR) repeat protein
MAAAYADSSSRVAQPFYQAQGRQQLAALKRFAGQMRDARRLAIEAEEINLRRGVAGSRVSNAIGLANGVVGLAGRSDEAVRILDSVLANYSLDSLAPTSRPYLSLAASYARAGAVSKAEGLVREYEQVTPEVLQRNNVDRLMAKGMIELASNKPAEAITTFRAYREEQGCPLCWLREIGQAFDMMQQPDSAIASYEALATTPEMGVAGRDYTLPMAYRRLGELYEAKGEVKKALEYYGKFVDLWKDADPELQPRVADVRKRIAELSARER